MGKTDQYTPGTREQALVESWRSLVESSFAHNSELYADFASVSTGPEIHSFLLWDACQPPFFQYLERWLPKAPAEVRPALEEHIREEIEEDHSGLFRKMMSSLGSRFPSPPAQPDPAITRELNYTFSPECAAAETFGFFCGGFFATEIMSAKRCAQLHRGLVRAGVPENELTYLAIHMENDKRHIESVARDFIRPYLGAGGREADVERGIRDRLDRSGRYLRWYRNEKSR